MANGAVPGLFPGAAAHVMESRPPLCRSTHKEEGGRTGKGISPHPDGVLRASAALLPQPYRRNRSTAPQPGGLHRTSAALSPHPYRCGHRIFPRQAGRLRRSAPAVRAPGFHHRTVCPARPFFAVPRPSFPFSGMFHVKHFLFAGYAAAALSAGRSAFPGSAQPYAHPHPKGFSYGMLPAVPLYAACTHPEVIQLGITLYATG